MKTRRKQGRHDRYESALRDLQIELVKVQKHIIKHSHKVLVIFEGRDAAGKDTGPSNGSSSTSAREKPASWRLASRLTGTPPPGTFSAM